MKPILAILLTVIHVVVFAQEWQFFPKDSMRCYDNPLQDSTFIEGVDFTSYQQVDNQLEIDLGLFARFDKVTDTKWIQIKTANSNFGRKVLVNDTSVRLVFVESYNHQIHPDTFTFYTNKKVKDTWEVLENHDLRVEAEFKSVVHQGNDSLKYFMLHVTNKWNNKNFQFPMVLSKQKGLIETPMFYDILAMLNDLSQLVSVEIMPYKEKTYREFFDIEPGTEYHFSYSTSRDQHYTGNWTSRSEVDETRFTLNLEGGDYITSPTNPFLVIGETPFRMVEVDTVLKPKTFASGMSMDDTLVFNPIPSKYYDYEVYTKRGKSETFTYQLVCGKLLYYHTGGLSIYPMHDDTLAVEVTLSLEQRFEHPFSDLENIGTYNYRDYTGGVNSSNQFYKSHYVKFPDGCEVADNAWRTSSINNTLGAIFSLYPNPAHDFIKVVGAPESVKVVAIDMQGKHYNLAYENGKIDVRNLANGLYVFALQSEGKTQYIKQLIR